jgi:hypothetical protein
MKYITFKNIYHRLVAEGPTFFNKLRKIMLSCAGLGAALVTARSQYANQLAFIPESIDGYLIAIGLVGTFVASLTVSNPDSNPKVN